MTQLQKARFNLSEHERNIWVVVPESAVPFEAVLEPKFWAHVSAQMKPWDRIEIHAEDGAYFAELLVQDAGRMYAKVACLRVVKLDGAEVKMDDGLSNDYDVKYAGPHAKWRVVRKSDKANLKDGFAGKGEAHSWLSQHLKTIAA